MKIIVVGGNGVIGSAVVRELAKRHTVITAGRRHGEVRVDMTDADSIKQMYAAVGEFDAVIVTAGSVHFGELTSMTHADYMVGIHDKLMGQVNLVLAALPDINDRGSFTLTSGILSNDPIRYGSSASMVNGAVNSFVKAAAIEMPRGIRINAVSPTILQESMAEYGDYFLGYEPVAAARVALAYSKSVEGAQTGQCYLSGYSV